MALDGAVATGTALERGIVTGTALAATGTAPVVTGEIRTADGVGGMATDLSMRGTTSSSSEALAFPGGGVGDGVHGLAGDGAGATRMDITATVIPTTAAMVLLTMVMAMDTAASTNLSTDTVASPSLSTEMAASPESPNYNAGCNVLVITTDPLTESWGHKRGAQSGRTNRNTATWVKLDSSSQTKLAWNCNRLSVD